MRHQFFVSHSYSKLPQAKTVLITNLPDNVQTEDDLRKLLTYVRGDLVYWQSLNRRRFVPGGIHKVWIYRKSGDLPDWYDERLKACQKLENAECKLLRSALKAKRTEDKVQNNKEKEARKEAKKIEKVVGDRDAAMEQAEVDVEKNAINAVAGAYSKVMRPTHHTGKVPLTGPKVDTIEWCKVMAFLLALTDATKYLPYQGRNQSSDCVDHRGSEKSGPRSGPRCGIRRVQSSTRREHPITGRGLRRADENVRKVDRGLARRHRLAKH